MRTLTRRVELLEARHRAVAGVPEWLGGYDPASPEAQSWFESRFDFNGFYDSLTDAERSTYSDLAEVDPAAMDGDDLETMANLAERLQAFRRARSVNTRVFPEFSEALKKRRPAAFVPDFEQLRT